MDTRFLLIISIFTGVAAVALLVQMFVLVGLYLTAKATQARITSLADRVEPLIDTSRRMAEETRQQAREILGKLTQITEATRVQVLRIDEMLAEVSVHTRSNLELVDRAVAATTAKIEETVNRWQRTILAPVRGINGAAAAVRAVVSHLGRRRSADGRPTQEEDLFI
jgi:uncharacterized protein YoxC